MERINQTQLSNVLTVRAAACSVSLSKKDSTRLIAVMEDLARRYPSQDLEDSIGTFHADYKKLALKFGLPKVEAAIENLRITPGRAFFPRPDEIATELENMRIATENNHSLTETQRYMAKRSEWKKEWESPAEVEWRRQMGFGR